jgi:two-component system cell cycle sensor histidine kinase/response regulator CckA
VKPGRPTIALIEDELLLRIATARAIDDAGYNVISAASGVEGLALLRDYSIDLAVIDIILPGRLDGVQMINEARQENPNLRAVFISGRPPAHELQLTAIGPFLQKPYRHAELLSVIDRMLEDEDANDAADSASPS